MADLVWRDEVVDQQALDYTHEMSKYIRCAWLFSGQSGTDTYTDIVGGVDYTPSLSAGETLEETNEGVYVNTTESYTGFQSTDLTNHKTIPNASAGCSFIIQVDCRSAEVHDNNQDRMLIVTWGDTRAHVKILKDRYAGSVTVGRVLRNGTSNEVYTDSSRFNSQYKYFSQAIDGVITYVVNNDGAGNLTNYTYLDEDLIHHETATTELATGLPKIWYQGLGSVSSDPNVAIMRYEAIYTKDGYFTEDEIQKVVENPYQLFATSEDKQEEYGLVFDGVGHVSMPTFNRSNFVIKCKFHSGDLATTGKVLWGSDTTSTSRRMFLSALTTNQLNFHLSAVNNVDAISAADLIPNDWNYIEVHVAPTANTPITFIINGNQSTATGATIYTAEWNEMGSNFRIGSYKGKSSEGIASDLQITYMSFHYGDYATLTTTDDIALYNFNRTSGTNVLDLYGSANNATLVNFPEQSGYIREHKNATALAFDGVDGRCHLGTAIQLAGDFDLEVKFQAYSGAGSTSVVLSTQADGAQWIGRWNGTRHLAYWNGQINYVEGFQVDTDYKYRLVRTGSTVEWYINDALALTFTNGTTLTIPSVGRFAGGSNTLNGRVEYMKIAGEIHLDATASDHSAGGQPVLKDTVGGNDATGVGFATDGSVWRGNNGDYGDIVGYLFNNQEILTLVSQIDVGVSQEMSIKIKTDIKFGGMRNDYNYLLYHDAGNLLAYYQPTNRWYWKMDHSTRYWENTLSDGVLEIELRKSASNSYTMEVYFNGGETPVTTFTSRSFSISRLINYWSGIVNSITVDIGGVRTNSWDFTTGDPDTIIDTVGNNHATIVNQPTSGYLPVVEKQVFTVGSYGYATDFATGKNFYDGTGVIPKMAEFTAEFEYFWGTEPNFARFGQLFHTNIKLSEGGNNTIEVTGVRSTHSTGSVYYNTSSLDKTKPIKVTIFSGDNENNLHIIKLWINDVLVATSTPAVSSVYFHEPNIESELSLGAYITENRSDFDARGKLRYFTITGNSFDTLTNYDLHYDFQTSSTTDRLVEQNGSGYDLVVNGTLSQVVVPRRDYATLNEFKSSATATNFVYQAYLYGQLTDSGDVIFNTNTEIELHAGDNPFDGKDYNTNRHIANVYLRGQSGVKFRLYNIRGKLKFGDYGQIDSVEIHKCLIDDYGNTCFDQGDFPWLIKDSVLGGFRTRISTDETPIDATVINSILYSMGGYASTKGVAGVHLENCLVFQGVGAYNSNIPMLASTCTGSNNISLDTSAVDVGVGVQDVNLLSYFEDQSTYNFLINQTGQTALAGQGWNGSDIASWAYGEITQQSGLTNMTGTSFGTIVNLVASQVKHTEQQGDLTSIIGLSADQAKTTSIQGTLSFVLDQSAVQTKQSDFAGTAYQSVLDISSIQQKVGAQASSPISLDLDNNATQQKVGAQTSASNQLDLTLSALQQKVSQSDGNAMSHELDANAEQIKQVVQSGQPNSLVLTLTGSFTKIAASAGVTMSGQPIQLSLGMSGAFIKEANHEAAFSLGLDLSAVMEKITSQSAEAMSLEVDHISAFEKIAGQGGGMEMVIDQSGDFAKVSLQNGGFSFILDATGEQDKYASFDGVGLSTVLSLSGSISQTELKVVRAKLRFDGRLQELRVDGVLRTRRMDGKLR